MTDQMTEKAMEDTRIFTAVFMALPAYKKAAVLHYMNGMAAQEAIDRERNDRKKSKR